VIENQLAVKRHAAIRKANQLFGHYPPPFFSLFDISQMDRNIENRLFSLSTFPPEKQAS
jgi:hypothetical protein